jgi:peptidyl-prolyl cis-trans isomerase A (cyclophilin A)
MTVKITIESAHSIIAVELDAEHVPKTVAHFLRSSRQPGVPPGIDLIQDGVGLKHCVLLLEVGHEPTTVTGLRHRDGTISLACSVEKNASSEFFICIGDQPHP